MLLHLCYIFCLLLIATCKYSTEIVHTFYICISSILPFILCLFSANTIFHKILFPVVFLVIFVWARLLKLLHFNAKLINLCRNRKRFARRNSKLQDLKCFFTFQCLLYIEYYSSFIYNQLKKKKNINIITMKNR